MRAHAARPKEGTVQGDQAVCDECGEAIEKLRHSAGWTHADPPDWS